MRRPVSRSIRSSASLTTPKRPQREEVDLHEAELLDVLLVVLGDDTIGHRRALDRDELDERRPGDEHAADVMPRWRGKPSISAQSCSSHCHRFRTG
jgi:hypothetical protein